MPIKMLRVSFNVSVEDLLKVVAEKNTGLDIQAYQTAVEPTGAPPLAIEDHSKGSLRDIVLQRLRHTGKPVRLLDLQSLAMANNYSTKQLGNLLFVLTQNRIVLRPRTGIYQISKRHL